MRLEGLIDVRLEERPKIGYRDITHFGCKDNAYFPIFTILIPFLSPSAEKRIITFAAGKKILRQKDIMKNHPTLAAHLCMLMACIFWGLLSPLGKDVMLHGIDSIDLVSFRVLGTCILFWAASIFVKQEHVSLHDKLLFALAAVLGLILNQCLFMVGLQLTSPANASIETTATPIITMLLAFLILKEPLTAKKMLGISIGCAGALILILTSAKANDGKVGNIWGDFIVIASQTFYALFLIIFSKFIKKYSVFTTNKWLFLWGTVLIWPFTLCHVAHTDLSVIPLTAWLETGYVILFGTFLGYLIIMKALKVLSPTVVSIYNYVQPVVAVAVSLLMGIGVLKWSQGLAILLVFAGVWIITKAKSDRK
jgi:drug/metabolite transporter (DMT)-like permease